MKTTTNLKDKISSDIIKAMKSGDTITRDTLRVLMSEVQRGQISEDDAIVSEVKKMIQNLELTPSETSLKEISVLEAYMPQQLGEGDMILMVGELIDKNNYTSMKDMGTIMNYFATNYPNQYDGKKLSIITRNQLNK